MIGGEDIVFEGIVKLDAADFLVRGIRAQWPNAIIQYSNEREAVPLSKFDFPVLRTIDVIIYQDESSYESWIKYGGIDENQDSMIQLIVDANFITFVVDKINSSLANLANDLIGALLHNHIISNAA